MKSWMLKSLAIAAVAIGMTVHAMAQDAPARVILVSLEDRKLALVEDGQVKKIYNVAVGKPSTPSPEGTFTIERRVVNPVYRHNGRRVEPGPSNPVGSRWMGLNIKGFGIHGTNEPNSIGKAASHGCIRMSKADLEELYALVAVGDQVRIVGQRNEETARLFEPAQQQPIKHDVQVAKAEPAPATPAALQDPAGQETKHVDVAPVAMAIVSSR